MHRLTAACACIACAGLCSGRAAERIKDLAGIAGVRGNQLIGYGLVVGLDGTGDQTTQTPFTIQSIKQHARAVRRQCCRRTSTRS